MSEHIDYPFKRTEGIGGVRVTTLIPADSPVYLGVMDALEELGGTFPDHVGKIRILPDTKLGRRPDTFVSGRCRVNVGNSRIEIFAGSIESTDEFMPRAKAKNTVLHEIFHSEQSNERRQGLRLDRKGRLGEKDEDDADNRVRILCQNHLSENEEFWQDVKIYKDLKIKS